MTVLPKLRCKVGEAKGVELFIKPPLLDGEYTFVNINYASGVASYAVDNGLKFAVNEYLVFGNIGAEKTEIIKLHASTAPTATTLTMSANSSFAHNRGDRVSFIPFNQVVVERSTDSGANYTVLTTIDIRVDSTETYYNHTSGTSTDYYRIRFKDEANTLYSSYSDEIVATGYANNTAGAIIRKALMQLGEDSDDEVITKEFLFEALTEGRNEIDNHPQIIRWPFRTEFDYDAGNVIPGTYKLAVPSTLRDQNTNQNILSLRIGKSKRPLIYIDKQDLNTRYEGIAHTTLNGAVVTADTEIDLTSSGDFDESGAIDIAAQAVNETIDNVDYDGNDESANQISTVTGIRTAGHATLTDVWQGASFGLPQRFTVDNGEIIFEQPFADDYDGENIWMDFYKVITDIDSDADILDEPFAIIYIPWMKWKIKSRKDPSLKSKDDNDYQDWEKKKEEQVLKLYHGSDMRININVPC